jgi:AraC-like DNA-binding protein
MYFPLMTSPSVRERITFGRESRTVRIGAYRVIETHHRAGTRLARHDHEAPSLNVVLEGGFDERIGARNVRNSPGTLVAKPAGAHHANEYVAVRTISILVQPDIPALQHLGSIVRAFGEVRCREGERVLELGRTLWRVLHDGGEEEMAAELLLDAALRDLAGCATRVGHMEGVPVWARRIREQIVARACERISIGALARDEGIELPAVSKAFSRYYGCTPTELLRATRIERAKRMLSAAGRSLSEIALSTGFADQAHLTRAFKRETALAPGQYRRLTMVR